MDIQQLICATVTNQIPARPHALAYFSRDRILEVAWRSSCSTLHDEDIVSSLGWSRQDRRRSIYVKMQTPDRR